MDQLFRSLLFEISVTDIMGDGILDERYVSQLFLEYRAANFPAMAGGETPTTWDKLLLTIIMDEVQGNLHRPIKNLVTDGAHWNWYLRPLHLHYRWAASLSRQSPRFTAPVHQTSPKTYQTSGKEYGNSF